MKHFKSVIAMVLALVMVLSCIGTAFAAPKTEITDIAKPTESASSKEAPKGFKSESFQKLNSYQYADDQIVRAIVILEGEPEADVAENGSEKAAAHRVKLINEHNTVRKAMTGISYKMAHEFTTLLNGFSCDVAYGDLEAIAALDGVVAVHIANEYTSPVVTAEKDEKQNIANQMTGNSTMLDYGFMGEGIVIAVLDTGLNTTHEAFQDKLGLVEEVITEETGKLAAAKGTYLSAKVPFAYDYADKDNDVTDVEGHGTHVSGTAVGCAVTETEDRGFSIDFLGAAPAAQLLSMKIFHDEGGGTTSDIYFLALEDAYRLGADVVNMSIGSTAGFTYDAQLETEVFGNIYERLETAGVICSISAGNEYSMAEYANYLGNLGYIGPEYTDYGTVGNPSTYEGNFSVASVENAYYPDYVLKINGQSHTYVDSSKEDADGWLENFGDQELEYVIVTDAEGNFSLGFAEDYANVDVTGKIAVVSRGGLTFEEIVEFAANAGAIGCIVVNHQEGIISMAIETFEIPAISMQLSALEALIASADSIVGVPSEKEYVANANGYLMSEFSNWGTSPMLTLDPTITSVGGYVYSSINGESDAYEIYSGTSMAAPNATGTFATILSAIYEIYPDMAKAEAAQLAKDLLAGNAEILTDADGYLYSVRKQGAGLARSDMAFQNYLTAGYITNPLQELGDDAEKTGIYEMSINLKNDSLNDVTYGAFETYVLYDYAVNASAGSTPLYINTLTSDYAFFVNEEVSEMYGMNYADVSYSVNGEEITEIALAVGEEVTVDVTITLDAALKQYLDAMFENGTFIEGFVAFNAINEGEAYATLHATFLSYYGDWTQAPVLESTDFRDVVEATLFLKSPADEEGNTYEDNGYTLAHLLDFYTSPNIAYITDARMTEAYAYAGDNMLGYTDYYEEHISFSTPLTDGTWNYAELLYMVPYQLRNAEHLIMTVSNKETGEIYYVDDTPYLRKAVYDEVNGVWQNSGLFYWDGKDASGNYVPSGTVATVTYDAILSYNDAVQEDIWTMDVTVDYTAPTLDEIVYDKEAQTLTVTATDENYLSAIYLADADYAVVDAAVFSSDVKGETFTATFDMAALGLKEFYVIAMDYATNEMETEYITYEKGLDATILLHTPYGTEEISCLTGDTYAFAEAPAIEDGDFYFWTTEPVENADDVTLWDQGGSWYFAADEITITETVNEFYALYAIGSYEELAVPNYFYNQPDDYSGQWAICGWDYDYDNGRYTVELPAALNGNGEKIYVADLEDILLDDYYVQFGTASLDICFNFEKVDEDYYLVSNAATGKYLTLEGEALVMADEASDAAVWNIYTYADGENVATLMYNAEQPEMILLYDDELSEFFVVNDYEYMDWALAMGYEIYPSEYYMLPLYQRETETLVVEYYTTELCFCQETEIRDAKDPTCTEEGYTGDTYCTVCGKLIAEGEAIPALGHNYGEWTVTKAPTALVAGEESRVCADCGETETREIPALGYGDCYFENFTDCEARWYHEAVDFVVSNKLMNGIASDKFAPDANLTRGMVVTVLYRAAGEPEVAEASTFADVAADAYYAKAVAWAQDNEIVNGISATSFAPEQNVTREQIAAILYRAAGEPEADGELMSKYADSDKVSAYAKDAMAWAVAEGIFLGNSDNELKPADNATRAEFACIIMRTMSGSYECENLAE